MDTPTLEAIIAGASLGSLLLALEGAQAIAVYKQGTWHDAELGRRIIPLPELMHDKPFALKCI